MSRPLIVGSYLQVTWWALGQWKGIKNASNDNCLIYKRTNATKSKYRMQITEFPATLSQHKRVLREKQGMLTKFLFHKCLAGNTGFCSERNLQNHQPFQFVCLSLVCVMTSLTRFAISANATLWWLHRLAKQKVLFLVQPKISRRCPWKTELFEYVSSENEAQINKNNNGTMLFMSKQVSLPKISSSLQKIKIGPKSDIRPFFTKAFNYQPPVLHVSNKTWTPVCLSDRLPLPSRQSRMKSYLPGKNWNFLVLDDRTAHSWTLYLTIILH